MDLDLPQLHALAAAVDEGSFDAAARVLSVTPSAVSQRIKALEATAGQVLLLRGKPVQITEVGQAYLRLARQITALTSELGATTGRPDARPVVALAVNGDSLGTWVLPALAPLAGETCFDIRREDQDHSAALLRQGVVMAAITTAARPVQGCRVSRLGVMRYRPMASPAYVARWLPDGPTLDALAAAPLLVFDRRDELQDTYLRRRTRRRLDPPRHHIPSTADFGTAVRLGMGWGMLPEEQSADAEHAGDLVDIDPGRHVDVALNWQQWSLRTVALDRTADAIRAAARVHLRRR
ncbi:LysR family transcriptional regulator ArgP [Actinocatenispora rupis]|uniref:Transcriptional regulator ArgP n=1 Tax=Actinocatenispora rupis TaxID=519421 RepID=A0A8J3J1U3_9ACTN|nr:LysR family transcriptional regulator ArgP [Actinocatenispora rupis]GID10540.1 transcriptional regulator ArgP [Actinocatenispora rupis]